MTDWEKILSTTLEKIKTLDEKIKKKMDDIDSAVNNKLKKHGFGWNDGEDGVPTDGKTVTDEDDDIEKLAPYMEEDALHELVENFISGGLSVKMKAVLPFLKDGDISRLLTKIDENGGEFNGLKLIDIMPFAGDMEVDELFVKYAKEGRIEKQMIPFISEECWHRIVKEYCADEKSKLEIDSIYPYLDDKDLKILFKTYIKRRKHKKA